METTHEVKAGKTKTIFTLAGMPAMCRFTFDFRLQHAASEGGREALFDDIFYWLFQSYEIEGGETYNRSAVILAMGTPAYAQLVKRVAKTDKSMRDFLDKICAEEPEQKPAVEIV